MGKYYYIDLNLNDESQLETLEAMAFGEYDCAGAEDFSIDEPKVDEILGERSYSGGDLPLEVIEEVIEALKTQGISGKRLHFPNLDYCNKFAQKLKGMGLSDAYEIHEGDIKDWNENWKENFKTIKVTEELSIVPSWEKKEDSENDIFIYPGMGFGTGSHETTFLCLKIMLEKLMNEPLESCLDFGCGSGILGVGFSQKFSSSKVVDYLDIDQEALDNCQVNLDLNPRAKLDARHLVLPAQKNKLDSQYDLVFANILLDALIAEGKEIVEKTGKYLIVSGLLKGQEKEAQAEYEKLRPDLKLIEVQTKNDWVAALFEVER